MHQDQHVGLRWIILTSNLIQDVIQMVKGMIDHLQAFVCRPVLLSKQLLYAFSKQKKNTMNRFNDDKVKARVDELRTLRTNWKDIAEDLGVSPQELRRWRARVDYKDVLRKVTDSEEVDALVKLCGENHPERGERILRGAIITEKCNVTSAIITEIKA
jgi:hypothetical protein